ncbi:MAG: AAA family ATPase [bacterium]|nr:AAA family ATPase [bacterium]
MALKKWLVERGASFKVRGKTRVGVPITRKEFTAIPLREMNLIWTDRSTAFSASKSPNDPKAGTPKPIEIEMSGKSEPGSKPWSFTLEFRYANTEMVYVRPTEASQEDFEIPQAVRGLNIVYVPPFSGLESEEPRHDTGYQNLLIGQGRSGEIVRNLLWELWDSEDKSDWDSLRTDIEELFGYYLLNPDYGPGKPFIICEYIPGLPPSKRGTGGLPKLDIANAGSGLGQVLLLLAFFYARKASVLLLDEPDAHLHFILQREVYDRLKLVARQRQCQLIIATHSEVLLKDTSPDRILSFFRKPHLLISRNERDHVREALKRLSSINLLLAEQGNALLYVESESDYKILREWARILDHPARDFLDFPYIHSLSGRKPAEARAHLFALRAVRPDVCAVLLLDGDNRNLPDREVGGEGLSVLRWRRYEIESYLVVPSTLKRFVQQSEALPLLATAKEQKVEDELKSQLPPSVISDPFADNPFLSSVKASDDFLVPFLERVDTPVPKTDLYLLAQCMTRNEIHPEVIEKLDVIADELRTKI